MNLCFNLWPFRVSMWPRGLRRCVQVAVYFGRRRFEGILLSGFHQRAEDEGPVH
uniref:Uncharacterized protein n=1 Tax=Syphacia muris TaxID=451379 RepID=A0A0N5ALW4_9BILA